ncbi:MAG: nitroreductase family protein [Dehalococcoidales bacterium]|nr:nitroreductase family protein [Dehalococcoidales bacterium]
MVNKAEMIRVDRETCTQCGLCAAACPGEVLQFRTGEYPVLPEALESYCVRCGHCVSVCPTGSLTHHDMPAEGFSLIRDELKINPEQCEQLLRSRRSIRAYKSRTVPREIIKSLIETARYAPTGHNNQEIEWMVIDNPDRIAGIEMIGTDWIHWMIKNRPGMAGGFNLNIMLQKQERDHNLFLRNAPALLVTHAARNNPIALIDSSIALSYLDLAAFSRGLGCCWAGFVYFMATGFAPLIEALDLPDGHSAYGCMMLGYPRFSYQRMPFRKPPVISFQA